jgi:hypothetical protein
MRDCFLIIVIIISFALDTTLPQSAYLYLNSTEYQMKNRTARKSFVYTVVNNPTYNPTFYFYIPYEYFSKAPGENFNKLLTYDSKTNNLINMVLYKSYTFTISNTGSTRKGFIFETPGTPVQIISTDITSSGSNKIISVTTDANPANNNENVYVNISYDDFATSTAVRQVNFAANSKTGSVTILSSDFNNNSNYKFYVFTSPMPLSSLNGAAQSTIDLATIDWDSVTYRPLPVELASFTGLYKKGTVELSWSTATEVCNYGFNIERSINKKDWDSIAFISGNGTSNSTKNYKFFDKPYSSGKQYYRLRQIDTKGTFVYSDTIEVGLGVPNVFELNQNFPNPFNPNTNIKFSVSDNIHVDLYVYNILGEKIASLYNGNAEAGRVYSVCFNGANMPSGVYFYRLNTPYGTSTKKMILNK